MKNIILILIIATIAFISCDEAEVHSEFNNSDFWEEHHSMEWDSTSTANNLLGTWNWVYNVCCPLSSNFEGVRKEQENIKVRITNTKIELIEKGKVIQTSKWSINLIDYDLYGIVMESHIPNLGGRILFSNNHVLFNDSYIDGADNYYSKEDSVD